MHRILILGPQGCGKGTQANILAERLHIPQISMGHLLRETAAGTGRLAEEVRAIQQAGKLVPGELTFRVLAERLAQPDVVDGYILDGMPRNEEQYIEFAKVITPTAVIVINVPREISLTRLLKRAQEEHRADDTPETIEQRLRIYENDTKPMLDHYRALGLVREVDGSGTIQEVADSIFNVCTEKGGC